MTIKKIKIVRKGPVELAEVKILRKRPEADDIFKFYKVDSKQKNEIGDFLKSNIALIPVLLEARIQIERLAGKFPLHLDLDQDPEEGFKELFVVVKANKSPAESISLEQKLDREWFIPFHSDLMNKLNFDFETN
jgi:hypothetical protein